MIPKIIHYCWFGPKPLPKVVKQCVATWHKHMPDYEYMLWNEDNSPMEHPFVKSAYEAKKYAFVADYVRFWALYNYGGVYLDTDMYVLKSFDDLLSDDFFAGWETADGSSADTAPVGTTDSSISCGALGACALGAPVKAILDKYDTLVFEQEKFGDYVVPRLITPILLRFKDVIKIYPHDYFYPLPFEKRFTNDKMQFNTANTYAVHLWDLSWYPKWRQYITIAVKSMKSNKFSLPIYKLLHYVLSAIRLIPIYLTMYIGGWRLFNQDIERWSEWKSCPFNSRFWKFVFLMTEFKEFRNICYYRMGKLQYFLRWMCPALDSLYIRTKGIGGGLLIQHGFASIIQAEHIGENFKVFQQVTIGYNGDERPWIGDNVEICCGAKVIGGVRVGNNVVVGAQALVIKDVPDNSVVGGVPAKILKIKG